MESDFESRTSGTGRANLEDTYVNVKTAIQRLIGNELNNTILSPTPVSRPPSSRLPRLALTSFNENQTEYKNFITPFLNFMNKDKCNNLRKCLTGSALEAIRAFPVS